MKRALVTFSDNVSFSNSPFSTSIGSTLTGKFFGEEMVTGELNNVESLSWWVEL